MQTESTTAVRKKREPSLVGKEKAPTQRTKKPPPTKPGPLMLVGEVEELTRLTKPTIYKLMRQNSFPRQVRVGEYKVAWYRAEIDAWVQSLANQRGQPSIPK